jgi:tripartite-type tricarboxylate transporter receptor subunit TctC
LDRRENKKGGVMQKRNLKILVSFLVASHLLASAAIATPNDFYAGKTIRFIVGFAAGGGYDAYTRTVARYISRHIPGNPSTLVENMDGAGSVIATKLHVQQGA